MATPLVSIGRPTDRVVPLAGGDSTLFVFLAPAAIGDQQLRTVTGPLLRVVLPVYAQC